MLGLGKEPGLGSQRGCGCGARASSEAVCLASRRTDVPGKLVVSLPGFDLITLVGGWCVSGLGRWDNGRSTATVRGDGK